MDIQFVLDVYACAMYIVSNISKAQKGMSELLGKYVTKPGKEIKLQNNRFEILETSF